MLKLCQNAVIPFFFWRCSIKQKRDLRENEKYKISSFLAGWAHLLGYKTLNGPIWRERKSTNIFIACTAKVFRRFFFPFFLKMLPYVYPHRKSIKLRWRSGKQRINVWSHTWETRASLEMGDGIQFELMLLWILINKFRIFAFLYDDGGWELEASEGLRMARLMSKKERTMCERERERAKIWKKIWIPFIKKDIN